MIDSTGSPEFLFGVGMFAVLGVLGGGVVWQLRRVRLVSRELRIPPAFVPFSVGGRSSLALARRVTLHRGGPRPGVKVERVTLGDGGGIFSYEPGSRARPGGALLWMHGGGLVMGTASQDHSWCSRLADELGVLVASVDYRLAPEHPYPAALDDCHGAARWLWENADDLGVDPTRIAVAGASAGGGLAAALAQRCHDDGRSFCFQLLVYPMLDDRTVLRRAPTGQPYTWTPRSNRFAWTSYLGARPREIDDRPYSAPARRADLGGLPSGWIGVGDIDLFHTEDVEYARRLRAAGVACELHIEPGMYHAADVFLDGKAPSMTRFRDEMVRALASALQVGAPR